MSLYNRLLNARRNQRGCLLSAKEVEGLFVSAANELVVVPPDKSTPDFFALLIAAASFAQTQKEEARAQKKWENRPLVSCQAASDGECIAKKCPQLRDNEPTATGRHCPIDHAYEEDLT